MTVLDGRRMFPCPLCSEPCEVRLTKKNKPYVICDPCGIQLFIRGPVGINAFERVVERAIAEDAWARFTQMERLYHLKCPKCGHRFWVNPGLIETSLVDGSLEGFRCPQKGCGAIVKWESKP